MFRQNIILSASWNDIRFIKGVLLWCSISIQTHFFDKSLIYKFILSAFFSIKNILGLNLTPQSFFKISATFMCFSKKPS